MTENQEILQRLARLEQGAPAQCTSENPHDQLAWDRKIYRCRCGMRYQKDGQGGLRDVD